MAQTCNTHTLVDRVTALCHGHSRVTTILESFTLDDRRTQGLTDTPRLDRRLALMSDTRQRILENKVVKVESRLDRVRRLSE